jgi:serine/threonine protein kinase
VTSYWRLALHERATLKWCEKDFENSTGIRSGMSAMSIGKFQVLGQLGAGAHSTILQIRRQADSKQYALKVVPIDGKNDQKFLEQAEHEFRVAQLLDHPNLIKVYAMETERNWLYRIRKVHLLIEYVNGKTLDTIPTLAIPHLVQVFLRAALGLVHMHRREVCHADLKPNNLLLSRTGDVKIIDYGLAWIKGEHKGRIQGTPEYMAPEQASGGVVNVATDIYNLGATMYRLVTRHHPPSPLPQGGLRLTATAWSKLLKPVQALKHDTPPALCELIHRCLEFHPHKRPESIGAVKDALEELVKTLVRSDEDRLELLEWE